jgi:ubiquinone/menaquinone biosynthesis C-methylase UbiE
MLQLASAASIRSYGMAAEIYDRYGPGIYRSLGSQTVEGLELDGVSSAVDLGCGAGAVTVALSQVYGARLVAIDVAKPMLRRARNEVDKARPLGKVSYRIHDMVRIEMQGGSQDLVVSNFALNLASELKYAIVEVSRILRPGGLLAGMVWAEGCWDGPAGAFQRHLLPLLPEDFKQPLTCVEAQGLTEQLAWNDFTDISTKVETHSFTFADASEYWRWLRGSELTVEMLEAMPDEERLAAIQAAKAELEPLETEDGLQIELKVLCVRATRQND